MNCVLCDALVNEPDRVIYKDEHVFVLVNIEPLKEGHIMILPIRHAELLKDLTPDESHAYLQIMDRCMEAVTEAYGETSMCAVNGWAHRSQPHLHAHILPSKSDLRGLYVASENVHERERADNERLSGIAEKLRPLFGA